MGMIETSVLKKIRDRRGLRSLETRSSLSEIFHENTKLSPLSGRAYGIWIQRFSRSASAGRLFSQAYKLYSLVDQVPLEKPSADDRLEEAIVRRRSVRHYTGEALDLPTLSRLLRFGYGRTNEPGYYRAVASGGAVYPLEIYFAALNIEGLERGIYHYNVEEHRLDVVSRQEGRVDDLKRAIFFEDLEVDKAAAVFVVSAIFRRSTIKYQDRGYRMVLMEAGEAVQNLCLLATAQGWGGCLLGGFQDDNLSRALGIDGIDEAPLVPWVIGRPRTASNDAP